MLYTHFKYFHPILIALTFSKINTLHFSFIFYSLLIYPITKALHVYMYKANERANSRTGSRLNINNPEPVLR